MRFADILIRAGRQICTLVDELLDGKDRRNPISFGFIRIG
jgi:hypothetical protein